MKRYELNSRLPRKSCIVNSVMNEGNENIVEVVVIVYGNVEDRITYKFISA